MKEVRVEVTIDAPANRVWYNLTDFASFPRWNPFFPYAQGTLELNTEIEVHVSTPNGKRMKFRPVIREATQGGRLAWKGRLMPLPGLMDITQTFEIQPDGGSRVKFVATERFGGLLVRFMGGAIEQSRAGLEQMAQALKKQAEQAST